jgi:hypothetical protein
VLASCLVGGAVTAGIAARKQRRAADLAGGVSLPGFSAGCFFGKVQPQSSGIRGEK